VELRGVTPAGLLRFPLPKATFKITYRLEGSSQERPVQLDTVLIEPDQSRFVLTWRSVFPCDKKALQVSEIEATLLSLN
jgi:hypothetical protein